MPAGWVGAAGAVLGGIGSVMGASGGGGSSGGDAGAAAYQAALDKQAIKEQNKYNNPDRISNTGREERKWIAPIKGTPAVKGRPAKYDKNGVLVREARVAAPAVPKVEGRWEVTQTMTPEMEAAQDTAMKSMQDWGGKAAAQGDFKGPDQIQWEDDGSQQAYADKFKERALFGVAEDQASQMEKFNTKLRQQGLQAGTPAYDRAMKNLMDSQGDVRTKATLDAYLASTGERRADYSTKLFGQAQNRGQDIEDYDRPLDRAIGMGGFGMGISPNLPGAGTGSGAVSTDFLGAYQNSQANKTASRNAQNAAMAEGMKGIAGGLTKAWDTYNTPKIITNDPTKPNYIGGLP